MSVDVLDDAMLMRKISAIRDGIRTEHLNPLWVEHMLQSVVENDRAGDFALRKVWATVRRPSLSDVAKVLARPSEYQVNFEDKLANRLKEMNWGGSKEEVDLTIVTMFNLFCDNSRGDSETENLIRTKASESGLLPCPDWVVPALALYAQAHCPPPEKERNFLHLNLCLESDTEESGGFGMFYRKKWHYYLRSVRGSSYWNGRINWLFVKPRRG